MGVHICGRLGVWQISLCGQCKVCSVQYENDNDYDENNDDENNDDENDDDDDEIFAILIVGVGWVHRGGVCIHLSPAFDTEPPAAKFY